MRRAPRPEVPVLAPSASRIDFSVNLPPDLARVIDAWPDLPDAIKTAIRALVEATSVQQSRIGL